MRGVYRTVYLDKQFLSPDPDSPSSKQNKTKQTATDNDSTMYILYTVFRNNQASKPQIV